MLTSSQRTSPTTPETISRLIREVLAIKLDDGVVFEPDGLRAAPIRDTNPYTGVRITVPASIAHARHPLRIDVNIGDPVTPAPVEIVYPALLGKPFGVVGYPIETVLAEKIVTVDRGDATTRERDFAGVLILTRRHALDARTLREAIQATGAHRGSDLRSLRSVLVELAPTRQSDWERFVDRSGLADVLPREHAEAISTVAAFADPILTGEVTSGRWYPSVAEWRSA